MNHVRNRHRIGSREASKRADTSKRVADTEKQVRLRGRLRGHSVATDLVIGVVILLATVAAIILYFDTSSRVAGARAKNREAAARFDQLQIETERIENEINKLKTDPAYLESVARLELGFVRAGDVVIKLDAGGQGMQTREVSAERMSGERVSGERVNSERISPERAEMRDGKKTGVDSASRGGL